MTSLIQTIQNGGSVSALAVTPDGDRIITANVDDLLIWTMYTGRKVLGPLKGHSIGIRSVAVSPDGQFIASGSDDETIRIWETETGNVVLEPFTGHTGSVMAVTFSYDGCLLISGSLDGTIRLWQAQTGRPAGEFIRTSIAVFSVTISPDGTKIAGGCNDGIIRVYESTTLNLIFECQGHTRTTYSVAFSPDGRFLASGSGDHTVRVWDATKGRAVGSPLEGHTDVVQSVTFSPDGRHVSSGSFDKTIRVWDVEIAEAHGQPLLGHTNLVLAVAFSPDGRFIISGSYDGTVKIWDVHSLSMRLENRHQPTQKAEAEITSTTSLQDIVSHLSDRGCIDMSSLLDWATAAETPFSQGGFGDIYRCKLNNSEEVAVKTLRIYNSPSEQNQKSLKHAAREVYTWSKCRHPNVQSLLGLVVFRGQIGMVATWEINGNLPTYLKRHPEADRCQMSTQVAEGLAYLHKSGVIHGDLKGANVLVSEDGVAQLADFGNSVLQEYTLQFSETSSRESLSFRWAAPELFTDSRCTKQADIYALGMTILETITSEVPWYGKSDPMVMFAVVMNKTNPDRPVSQIPPNSKYGDTLWTLLILCWLFEPEERPSAEFVASQMKNISFEGLTPEPAKMLS
ncbi:WD repeat and SOCS box-containing protein 1 [Ceratobasidium sp. AG-Ba]|nr:WD repeat and SOCS box-containing protein 1 [Ceratobasidium sp. AG-Ba]